MITQGQITLDTPMGRFLKEQAIHAETIVEIGTGSGLGSTRCLAEGMKCYASLHTYEADPGQIDVAQKNIIPWNSKGQYRIVFHNTIFHRSILPYYHPLPSPQVRELWDREYLISQKGHLDIPLHKIDLLLLDGGEFTSLGDFLLLWHRARVIVIDDCNEKKAVKNRDAFRTMNESKDQFEPLRIELEERNGWAAFKRKD
jgi:hypothetical protein